MEIPNLENFDYLIRIRFEVNGNLEELTILESIIKRLGTISMTEDVMNEVKEAIQHAWIEAHLEKKTLSGDVLIPVRTNRSTATLIASVAESIDTIRSLKSRFALLEIEDLQSVRGNIRQRAETLELQDDYSADGKVRSQATRYRSKPDVPYRLKLTVIRDRFGHILKQTSLSTYPIVIALILFTYCGVLLVQKDGISANSIASYAYLVLAIGGIWKVVEYLGPNVMTSKAQHQSSND